MWSRRVVVVVALAFGQIVVGCNAPQKTPVPPVTPAPTSATAGATTIVAIAPLLLRPRRKRACAHFSASIKSAARSANCFAAFQAAFVRRSGWKVVFPACNRSRRCCRSPIRRTLAPMRRRPFKPQRP
ncbi:MAG: hypothetical protein QM775_10755 [Pirellulales bacterium]